MARHDAISEERVAEIVAQVAEGVTLKMACEQAKVNYTNICERIGKSKVLTELHARARESYAHYQVQRMHEIADTEEDVNRARLKIDCIKWEAARVLPKVYGDKVTHAGDPEAPIEHNVNLRPQLTPEQWLQAHGIESANQVEE